MTGPTRRDIERRLETLEDAPNAAEAERGDTIELPTWATEELRGLDDPSKMSGDLAAAIREAELAAFEEGE